MASETLNATQDVVFHWFSATKAIGSIACMILLDRGLLELDSRIDEILPEFRNVQVLDSLGPDGPVYRPPSTPVTLRHLLTHTSGLSYPTWDARDFEWMSYTKTPFVFASTMASFTHPLMFDPGSRWSYGFGLDWAGFVVEKVDGRSIDRFCQEEIFNPLEMFNTYFETNTVTKRLASVKLRGVTGGFENANQFVPLARPERYGMGQACHGTARDFMKLLRLVLSDGVYNGRRVMSDSAVALLKDNQIGDLRLPFPMKSNIDQVSADLDILPLLTVPMTHTAGFARNEVNVPGRRRAGSLSWAGFLNTHFWIDPQSGIAAVLFSHFAPFNDARFQEVYSTFERSVYELYG
jgi:methyl acetate hydrolase